MSAPSDAAKERGKAKRTKPWGRPDEYALLVGRRRIAQRFIRGGLKTLSDVGVAVLARLLDEAYTAGHSAAYEWQMAARIQDGRDCAKRNGRHL